MDASGHPAWERSEALAAPALREQRALLHHICAVLARDTRIAAAFTTGSLADGRGDAQSDVDILIIVYDDHITDITENWEALLHHIHPTILRRRIGPPHEPILVAITPDWQRFDVVVHAVSSVGAHTYHASLTLFDRDGVAARLPPAPPVSVLSPERVLALVEEFLRVLGLLPIVIGRGEFLVGMDGAMLLRRMLIDLMLQEHGPVIRGGAKRLNPFLTLEQRLALEGLPPLLPTRTSVMGAHLACARLFIPIARRVLCATALPYPDEFEAATLAHLERCLGVRMDVYRSEAN